MRILAVDPSLSSTGMAILYTDIRVWELTTIKVPTPKPEHGPAGQLDRMDMITSAAVKWAISHADYFDHVVLESPAFSKNAGMAHERAGLWWKLFEELQECAAGPAFAVLPNLRTKYATGRGNAGKDEVMLAAAKRYPGAMITNNNEADAVVIAAMVARLAAEPVDGAMPKTHTDALRTIALPGVVPHL